MNVRNESNSLRRGWRRILLQVGAAILLVLGVFGYQSESQARLDPFYIVHGQSFGTVTPRVLFVLDTSGSMAFEQPFPDRLCRWYNCENENAGSYRSRMFAARRVMSKVVEANEGAADFALMTFGMAQPPKYSSQVPYKCYSYDWGGWYRFTWVGYANQPYLGVWWPLYNMWGSQGMWMLCGDNRPFPYLRHDNLGGFWMPNNSNEELLDEPLYKQKASLGAYWSGANYSRRVQWFPRYVGRRVNLDCSDPNQWGIAQGTYGDWANSNSSRWTQVCGRDYYYWPYVDGFPGYSYNSGYSYNWMWHVECNDYGSCWSTTSRTHRIGTNRRYVYDGATLYAPFYSEEILNNPGIPAANKGPLTEEDANLIFNGLTDDTYAGGMDASGGTPWASAIGDPQWYVNNWGGEVTAKPGLLQSNAAFSHTTVSSYLSFLVTGSEDDICRPTAAVLMTDGQPTPWYSEGGYNLYNRVRKLRQVLGVKTYLVGFSESSVADPTAWSRMHHIACAAAGSNSPWSPCYGTNNYEWDTCRDPDDPVNGCAWIASNDDELADALTSIISDVIQTDIPAGAPTTANDFQSSDINDPNADDTAVQTSISARTETPSWFGHVERSACTDEDPDNPGQLADYCADAATLPIDTEEEETFGPCPMGRVWDAGECLQDMNASDRRLFTHDADNNIIRIAVNGEATPDFINLVLSANAQGKINPPLTPGDEAEEIKAMTNVLLATDGDDGWKLPGIANSAPILIRRVPQQDNNFAPSVGIRDPHCAGRRNVQQEDAPASLKSFSSQAWATTQGGGFGKHYDYTEAVVVGDDFGLLHAFHFDSGNELFAFLPLALINNSRQLSLNPQQDGFGQPEGLGAHIYGIASTLNAGWVYDEDAQTWRHLGVFGFGPGGRELVAVDLSHMGRLQDDDPIDVVWTTETAGNATQYNQTLGETWSRPAITYAVPGDSMSSTPKAYLVFGSGYRNGAGNKYRGRTVWLVDAVTGETVTEKAYVPRINDGTTYDISDDVTAVGDVAVSSHCLSRYWGEMQEAYFNDPAGRLFRWDLAAGISDVTQFDHVADSGGTWQIDGNGYAVATEAFRFPACQGTDEFSCSIGPIGGSQKGDVFTYPPAVAANNRIDSITDPGGTLDSGDRDQFLIAMVSGNPNDDVVDGGDPDNDFHSSIYLLADDHRQDPEEGFDIPTNAPTTSPGSHAYFMRLPLNQIERTRTVTFPDGTTESQTRVFSKRARPIRAPFIRVTGVADGEVQQDAEVFYVSYTIYEPGDTVCDSRWYDKDSQTWVFDQGSTYEITFRLAVEGGNPFDFQTNYSLPGDPGDGFGSSGALGQPIVTQISDGCDDGNCGAVVKAPKSSPCDPNEDAPTVSGVTSIQTGWSELDGFSPLEIPL